MPESGIKHKLCDRLTPRGWSDPGQGEFIKLILLLFCSTQRLSFPRDTQMRESVVTRSNGKDLINCGMATSLKSKADALPEKDSCTAAKVIPRQK